MDETAARAERVRAALNGHRQRPPAWLDAMALVAEPEADQDWIIEGFLERQGRILLAGAEGSGKSLMALTAAVQAAAGITVLDRFPVPFPIRTVYIDLEMARSATRRRLRTLSISAELEPGALQVLHRPDGIDFTSQRQQRDLQAQLAQVQPELLVIDPLYKMTLGDSVYERDIKPALAWLDRMRLEFNTGLILVHHLRKRAHGEAQRGRDASDIFGSSVLLRWPETIMALTEELLWVDKDRDGTFQSIRRFPIQRGGPWPIQIVNPEVTGGTLLLGFIEANAPCTTAEIQRGVGGRRQEILRQLGLMESSGLIRKVLDRWEPTGD